MKAPSLIDQLFEILNSSPRFRVLRTTDNTQSRIRFVPSTSVEFCDFRSCDIRYRDNLRQYGWLQNAHMDCLAADFTGLAQIMMQLKF